MNAKIIYELLANQGIRIFVLTLGSDSTAYIHIQKTMKEWRSDIKNFISEIDCSKDVSGFADDNVFNTLNCKLHEAGYIEVTDVAADVYEGRIAVYSAGIEDDPAHAEQADGFGHYGWESKNEI